MIFGIPIFAMIIKIMYDPYIPIDTLNKFIALECNNSAILNPDEYFPEGSTILQPAWREIQAEAIHVMETYELPDLGEVEPIQQVIYRNGSWDVFMLIVLNEPVPENQALMPRTTELLKQCKGVRNAMLSILKPGVQILPHEGILKSVVRYMLALVTPEPDDVYLNLYHPHGTYHWREGEQFMFDDLYVHEVIHRGKQDRVLLFLDIDRTHLSLWGRLADGVIMGLAKMLPIYSGIHEKAKPPLKAPLSEPVDASAEK